MPRSYQVVTSVHLTAKTHQQIGCRATPSAAAALPNHVARLQMLKDRHA